MNRTLYHIVSAMMVIGFLGGCASGDRYEQDAQFNKAEQATDAQAWFPEDVFASGQKDTTYENVLIRRAEQKLQDLGDYLVIVANKHFPDDVRFQAKQMILELFPDSASTVSGIVFADSTKSTYTIEAFLAELMRDTLDSISLDIYGIKNQPGVEDLGNGTYRGMLSFVLDYTAFHGDRKNRFTTSNNLIQVFFRRSIREFGEEKVDTWEVGFGNMEVR